VRQNQMKRSFAATGLLWVALLTPAYGREANSVTQPRQNIAGNYRGLMTRCSTASEPNICRSGLTKLARLADEVDSKYVEWARTSGGADSVLSKRLDEEYVLALEKLNDGIRDFNRVMKTQSAL